MKSILCSLLTLSLLSAGLLAQPGKGQNLKTPDKEQKKSDLETLLEKVLTQHMDIRAAEARLQTAAVELEQVKAEVMQKAVQQYYAIRAQAQLVAEAERRYSRMDELLKRNPGTISREELEKARTTLIIEKSKLESMEAALNYFSGKAKAQTGRLGSFSNRAMAEAMGYQSLKMDKEKKQLNMAIQKADTYLYAQQLYLAQQAWSKKGGKLNSILRRLKIAKDDSYSFNKIGKEIELPDLINHLQDLLKISILTRDVDQNVKDEFGGPVAVRIPQVEEMPLSAFFEYLEDQLPEMRFVVRSYGLLLVPMKAVPPDAVLLSVFWKSEEEEQKKTFTPKKK